MKNLIDIDHGSNFPVFTRVLFVFVMFIFSVGMALTIPFGLLLVVFIFSPVVIYVLFTRSGSEIDLIHREVRAYIYTFFKKRGEWKSLDNYNQITLLVKNKSQRYNHGWFMGTTVRFVMYEVYLLNKTHRKKVYIAGSESKEKMKSLIKQLSDQCSLTYVKYSPKRIRRQH